MTLSYQKKIYPSTWKQSYTPQIQYEISFDTSSEYITNTITPFDVSANTTAVWNSSTPTRVVITDWQTVTNIDLTLADAQTSITWWWAKVNWTTTPMVSWTAITITNDTQFIPTVNHYNLWTISFDTSSPYITNTVTPFTIVDEAEAMYTSAHPETVTIEDITSTTTVTTMQLADEWTAITWWEYWPQWSPIPMIADIQERVAWSCVFIPTVTHTVIHKDTQWPCPNWFHIGTKDEWQALITALTTLWAYNVSNIKTYLKIPDAYYLARSSGKKETKYWTVRMRTSTMDSNTVAWCWWIDEKTKFVFQEDKPGNGFSIRPFKDKPVSVSPSDIGVDWTILYVDNRTGWWIFWNSTRWLISLTANWTDWYTISDKNLWATNVWDNWLFYQFWNNTGYTYNASPYVTSKPTLSDNYWPGNYYTGSFVRVSSGNNWFNWACNNIWWWVTNGTWTDPV